MDSENMECPLCGLKARGGMHNMMMYYNCKNCGRYGLAYDLISDIDQEWKPILSYIARKASDNGNQLLIEEPESIIKNNPLPNPAEQANNLIIHMGREKSGRYIIVDAKEFVARIGAPSEEGVIFILKSLQDKGMIEQLERSAESDAPNYIAIKLNLKSMAWPSGKLPAWRLTFTGWEKFNELKREGIESNRAFMAMQYNSIKNVPKDYSIPKKEWDKMFELFKEATGKTGFLLYKLIDKPEAGLIDDRMRVEIRNSKFTVADLTFDNRGAYWESGFAEGLGKKVIYTCEKKWFDKKKTHFDTNHLETIVWERDKLEEAAKKLEATIRNSFPADAKMTDD